MNPPSLPIAPWMIRRAALLRRICETIDDARARGTRMRSYRRGAARWNRSRLAQSRNRFLGAAGIRSIYARWKASERKSGAFEWKTPAHRKITLAQAIRFAKRIIAQGLTTKELFRRLQKEKGTLPFCLSTLRLALPGRAALREVRLVRLSLQKAESAAFAILYAKAKGAA
jgi:hypothetical protein